jgi:hypothetical protein
MVRPTIFFDPVFVENVIAGLLVTLVGGVLLLVAGVWWARTSDAAQADPRSAAWRTLCAIGWLVFLGGILWQLLGYIRIGAVTWPG